VVAGTIGTPVPPSPVIHLLGRPEIERDGEVVAPPRGRKAWAVLAYLLLTERRVSRATLAELMFADAADPLGALRWTLAQLRGALGSPDLLLGDPLALPLADGWRVDVLALADADPPLDLVRGELLEGVDPEAGPVFDAWLLVERRRSAGVCEAVLRDAALAALAAGRALDAAALATRALAFDPYDESAHELLVRCLVGAAITPARARSSSAASWGASPIRACGGRRGTTAARRPSAIAGRPKGSSPPGARRWTRAPSSRASRACARRRRRPARSALPGCWPRCSRRSAPGSSTRSAGATRRAPRSCTRRSRWPRAPATARWPPRSAASWGSSRSRRGGRRRRGAGSAARTG
jgi:hypothetical protein